MDVVGRQAFGLLPPTTTSTFAEERVYGRIGVYRRMLAWRRGGEGLGIGPYFLIPAVTS